MDTSGSAAGRNRPQLPVEGDEPPAAAPALSAGSPEPAAPPSGPAHLAGPLLVYSLLRLALIAVLTALLMFFMPLIVALLFAIIVQLPLSWLLFAGPRRRLNDAMARSTAKRRSERARLQSALAGDEPPLDR
jgi:hypothetical protein